MKRQGTFRRRGGIVGLNIGKNADTPIERALDDYRIGLQKVYAHADYVAVNISSPNTKDLRALQGAKELDGAARAACATSASGSRTATADACRSR